MRQSQGLMFTENLNLRGEFTEYRFDPTCLTHGVMNVAFNNFDSFSFHSEFL